MASLGKQAMHDYTRKELGIGSLLSPQTFTIFPSPIFQKIPSQIRPMELWILLQMSDGLHPILASRTLEE